MNGTTQKLDGVALAVLEAQLMAGDIGRLVFVEQAARLGLSAAAADATADKIVAIDERDVAALRKGEESLPLMRSHDGFAFKIGESGIRDGVS